MECGAELSNGDYCRIIIHPFRRMLDGACNFHAERPICGAMTKNGEACERKDLREDGKCGWHTSINPRSRVRGSCVGINKDAHTFSDDEEEDDFMFQN